MKLFGREDVDLVEELGPEMRWPTPCCEEDPVIRYRARLRPNGSAVVVRRFARSDERFDAAVALAKQIW